jgi:phosphatidylglycerol:prolipoprotein diacylglycerol transferase
MAPIVGRIGPLLIYSYTVVLGLSILLVVALVARRLAGEAAPVTHLLLSGGAALLGGRLAFVLANLDYYATRVPRAFALWQGGLGYHGALLAGLAVFWLRPLPARARVADAVAPGLLLLGAGGWLACYLEGCAYGSLTTIGPLAADLPDAFGVFDVRYQTQLGGILLNGLAFAVVFGLQRRYGWEAGGRWFWRALALASLAHALPSLLRGDEMPLAAGLRLDAAVDLLLVAIALALAQRHSRSTGR